MMNRKKVWLCLALSFLFLTSLVFAADPIPSITHKKGPGKTIDHKKNTARKPHTRKQPHVTKPVKPPHTIAKPPRTIAKPPRVISVKAPAQVKSGKAFKIEIKAVADIGMSAVQINFAGKKTRLSAKGKKSCTLKATLKSLRGGKQTLTVTAIDKKNHRSKTFKKNIVVLVKNKPVNVGRNNDRGTMHRRNTASIIKNKPPVVKKISAPLSVGSGQSVPVRYTLSDDKGLRAMLVTAWGQKKIIRLRGRTAHGTFKLIAGKPGTAVIKVTALDNDNLKSREITRMVKVRTKHVGGNDHFKPVRSKHQTQHSIGAAGSPSKGNHGNSFSSSVKQNPFSTVDVPADIGKGRRSLGHLGNGLDRKNDIGGRLPAGIQNSGNGFGTSGGAAGDADGIGKTEETIGSPEEEFADQMKPALVTGQGAQREGDEKVVNIIDDRGNWTTVNPSEKDYNSFVEAFGSDSVSVDAPSTLKGVDSVDAWAFEVGVSISYSDESSKEEDGSTVYESEFDSVTYTKTSVESQQAEADAMIETTHRGSTDSIDSTEDKQQGNNTNASTDNDTMNFSEEEVYGSDNDSNDDNNDEEVTDDTAHNDSDETVTDTSNSGNDDQDDSDDDSDNDDDDEEDDSGGDSNTAGGGREIAEGPDNGSTNNLDARWINQDKVKDTLASAPGGKGTMDYAPGEEGGTAGESGIGPGNFKDMNPSQVHTFDGAGAISHNFEDLDENTQSVIQDGGPTTEEIHTTQD